jgi:4-diphosphocytidyl-2-C-methyl-D-erythritol kinase
LLKALTRGRNDLEAPAIRLQPVIGEVLAVLRETDGVHVARMSGSGATCFAIYEDQAAAVGAAARLKAEHPAWWIHAGMLG